MKKMILMLCVVGAVFASANEARGQRGGEERTPPQEAITVCEGQESGAACEMTSPEGDTVSGTCEKTPDNKYFACKPEHGRPPRGQR